MFSSIALELQRKRRVLGGTVTPEKIIGKMLTEEAVVTKYFMVVSLGRGEELRVVLVDKKSTHCQSLWKISTSEKEDRH